MENGVYLRMAVIDELLKISKGTKMMKLIKNGKVLQNGELQQADILIDGKVINKLHLQLNQAMVLTS
ncbi:dihydroorotase [Staphylococcus aureus]|uniref:Dihydroorotase n=1 Tax=Staphylococcus aureus TaxID=1280 RepID=A0A380DYU1_STAAU|nr:dihydroorotase [Staphylococcus aureus]